MSRKKSKTLTVTRPVSIKAYNSFVDRILAVMPDTVKAKTMINALDRYLAGDHSAYKATLDANMCMAFEMLRFEIDKAIERSARARARAQVRRNNITPQSETLRSDNREMYSGNVTAFATPAQSLSQPQAEVSEESEVIPPLPRRLRRAAAHASKTKYKWQRIG